MEPTRREIQLTIEQLLRQGMQHGGRLFNVDEVMEACREVRSDWARVNIQARANRSRFGKFLLQYTGTYTLLDGRRVEFRGREGKDLVLQGSTDPSRQFTIKLL
jgi:hypothetical protein